MESSDDEGFGQSAELEDGKLTAPGWRRLYTKCISDGWSSCDDDYEDDISGDEPDEPAAHASHVETEDESEREGGVGDGN